MRAARLVVIASALAVVVSGCAAEPAQMDADLSHLSNGEDAADEGGPAEASPTEAEPIESDSPDARQTEPAGRITDGPTGVSFTLVGAGEPSETEVDEPAGAQQTMRTWAAGDDDLGAGVNVIELSTRVFDLNASLAGAAQNLGGTVSNTAPITIDDYEGRVADIELPDESVLARVAVVRVNTTVVQVFGLGRDGVNVGEVHAEFTALLESVDIP